MKTKKFPYHLYSADETKDRMNLFGKQGVPFLFIINYAADKGYVIKSTDPDSDFIRFSFHNTPAVNSTFKKLDWNIIPISKADYQNKFDYVQQQLKSGKVKLINLTQPTSLSTNITLERLYESTYAPYKLWLKDKFLVLSPEIFVQIEQGEIKTFPMKGTIDALIPDAEKLILNDLKEMDEHAAIVELLSEDLRSVADDVQVVRYRYIDRIKTIHSELLQVSSEITGKLPEDYRSRLGDILFKLLPAGSICGAPKAKSIEIIREAEGYDRGFYSGVCGIFDGEKLDSTVMIRFIEQTENGLVYKSGGGITAQSIMEKEYNELIQKIYVPVS